MTTYAGRTAPLLLSPENGGSANPFPTFTAAPFEMADAFIIYNLAVEFNLQFGFSASTSALFTQLGNPFVTVPQQFGTNFPGVFQAGFFYRWVADIGIDPCDSFFPALGTLIAVGNYNVGISRPAVGVTKDCSFVFQGIDTDASTVIAQATYRIQWNRP